MYPRNFCTRANFPKEYIHNSNYDYPLYYQQDRKPYNDTQYCDCDACRYQYHRSYNQAPDFYSEIPPHYPNYHAAPRPFANHRIMMYRHEAQIRDGRIRNYVNPHDPPFPNSMQSTPTTRRTENLAHTPVPLIRIEDTDRISETHKSSTDPNSRESEIFNQPDRSADSWRIYNENAPVGKFEQPEIKTVPTKSETGETVTQTVDLFSKFLSCITNGIFHKNCRNLDIAMNILRLTDGNIELSMKVLLTGANLPLSLPYHMEGSHISQRWSELELEKYRESLNENLWTFNDISKKIETKSDVECKLLFIKEFYYPEKLAIKRCISSTPNVQLPNQPRTENMKQLNDTTKLEKIDLFIHEYDSGIICWRCYLYLSQREQELNEKAYCNEIQLLVKKIKHLTFGNQDCSVRINICKLCDSPISLIDGIKIIPA